MIDKSKIKFLIRKYEYEVECILKRRHDLTVKGDFTPDGIKVYCNCVVIEDLKNILYNR